MSLCERIVEILEPLTGRLMAQSTVNMCCQKIGVKSDSLAQADLPAFAEKLMQCVTVFIGTEKAQELGRKVASLV